ncbi:hypothetical protein FNV43_RR05921 [Rhamnella rubrinervis]|uniref:Uncharacterized protein n=1 Tax=Rhamnella rubrinervis TaxID=2594499 RepID=A0A8K0ML02_9ROSA|nr:hypothetical protein FNV43_RR05921 [Rhamnella rubrinervis]
MRVCGKDSEAILISVLTALPVYIWDCRGCLGDGLVTSIKWLLCLRRYGASLSLQSSSLDGIIVSALLYLIKVFHLEERKSLWRMLSFRIFFSLPLGLDGGGSLQATCTRMHYRNVNGVFNTDSTTNQNAPISKGNFVSIRVNDNAYKERISLCQFSLIARVVLTKGDKSWKHDELYLKLQSIWKLEKWKLISLVRDIFKLLYLHGRSSKSLVSGSL